MRLLFSLFFVLVTYVMAVKDTQRRGSYNLFNYYGDEMESIRQMMTMSFILPSRETVTQTRTVISTVSQPFAIPTRKTILEVATSTSTITCTQSVAVPCSVRIRVPTRVPSRPMQPLVLSPSTITTMISGEDEKITEQPGTEKPIQSMQPVKHTAVEVMLSEEQLHDILNEAYDENEKMQWAELFPSAVQEVEPTSIQQLPFREGRLADPHKMDVYGNRPEDIESGFHSGPYHPVAMPFNRRYVQPALPMHRRYVEPAAGQQRQFLQQFFTVTRRSTIYELAFSTVTPLCSEPGRLHQCPVEKKKTKKKNVARY